MLSSTCLVERTAAAGSLRAIADPAGRPVGLGVIAADRGWATNPFAMTVKTVSRHDLTPAPRPEEAVP